MFIQTEPTPNPDTIKFLPGQEVVGSQGPFDFADADAARGSLLARGLFQVDGVERVFLGRDFVSITKDGARDWKHIKPMVLAAIMDHYLAGLPIIEDSLLAGAEGEDSGASYTDAESEIVDEIKELIDTRVRPAVAQDGGDIIFHKFEPNTGIVHLSMRGACAGCPSSSMTLKHGIENMLKAYVPEVTAVEAVL